MAKKHTPGPLVVLPYDADDCWFVMKDSVRGKLVATVDTSEADALLFAAALDMYKALPDLSHVIRWLQNGCDPIKAANELQVYQERIDRAKAKAEGEP